MPYTYFDLPKYPCERDMWDELKNENRPIVIYGMGNGAEKLIDKFKECGITFADIFASDGFVRGHSFRGIRVKSFSEIKESYKDFVIVLSFASNKEDVISMLNEIDKKYVMYVPDMPIANVAEYFTKDFYNENYEEILKAYDRLTDTDSKNAFSAILNYKLSGKMTYLMNSFSEKSEMYDVLPRDKISVTVDVGAYNGDTVRESKEYFHNLKKVHAIEPDSKNFKKLARYSEAENDIEIKVYNAAAWSEIGEGALMQSGNRNSSISSTSSYEYKSENVSFVTVDSLDEERIDYIKYDVEGAEKEALLGSHNVIARDNPVLLVSLYHRSRDIFEIINLLYEKYNGYNFYLRRLKCIPSWEVNLIMIPKN